jgi:apolipoprotein N-acyltransferase
LKMETTNSLLKKLLGWMFLGGVMLGASFPPLPFGVLAIIAFVPLFLILEETEGYWRSIRYAYGFFFVFNLITLYWPGGFVHAKDIFLMLAGLAVIVFHPVFFLIAILPFVYIKKRFGVNAAVLTFPFVWVSFEYLHSLSEYSFPWLLLGSTQTYNLSAIQFASITGVYGISFWLICINVAFYLLYVSVIRRAKGIRSAFALISLAAIIVIHVLPQVYGLFALAQRDKPSHASTRPITIALVQPNIDPFDKWTYPPEEQVVILDSMTVQAAKSGARLVVWPETAIPTYLLHPLHGVEFARIRRMVDTLGINLLTGVPDIHYYPDDSTAPKSAMVSVSGKRFDSYNSTILLTHGSDSVQKYHKIHLVPYAERVPYSELLSFMNAMKWNFGLGGWGIGRDTTIFQFPDSSGANYRFSNAICFESIYPGFVAAFVRKGAEFITVITNDSWWGNTSGVYQHKQLAVLRAVENRRWVVQCSNGGVSCFVDPYGYIYETSKFNTRCISVGTIQPIQEMTFYTLHGDWFAEICLVLSVCFLAAAAGKKTYDSIRSRDNL